MRTRPSLNRPPQGFSLMEIILGLVLLGLLGVAGSKMMAGSFYTTQVIDNQHLANSTARYALERMARDIRQILYDPLAVNNKLKISTMAASQLSFTKSMLLLNTASTPNVSFSKDVNNNLQMTVDTVTATLANNVSSLIFTYLDDNLNTVAPTDTDKVRIVRISLTLAPPQAQAITLLTQVRLRNV